MQNDITLPDPDRRQMALERSQQVSRALHDAARKARQSVRGQANWQPAFSRAARGTRTFALVTLLVICVVPTLVAATYLGLVAADQFQAEAQFAIKSREISMSDFLGGTSGGSSGSSSGSGGGGGGGAIGGFAAMQAAQDSLIVTDYVQSRALVEKLDREIGLREMFSRSNIDWFWRFDPTQSVEELVRYWKKRIHIDVSLQGAIVTLTVRAFSAVDAERIAVAVVAASEQLVNSLSDRSRQDALSKAAEEVAMAERKLVEVRGQMLELRNRERVIDPKKSSEETLKVLTDLRADRLKLESEIRLLTSRAISPNASSAQTLRNRLDTMNGQIATLERSLTTLVSTDPTMAEALTRFDKAKLDQDWAEKFYTTAAASLEKARIDLGRQQVYLESFVEPLLPQEAEFPRRLWLTSLVGLGSFGLWFLLNYLRTALRG